MDTDDADAMPDAAQTNLESRLRHDMLQPTAALHMLIHRLSGDTAAPEPRLFAAMQSAVEELDTAISRIVFYERLAHGVVSANRREAIDVGPFLEHWASEASRRVRAAGLVAYLDNGVTHGQLVGDESLLARALDEGVANAVDFSPAGKVAILARLATSDVGVREIVVSIVDEGVGLPMTDGMALGSPFFAPATSWSRRFARQGLGLAIASLAGASFGGRAGVEPNPTGRPGATFTFRAPLAGHAPAP